MVCDIAAGLIAIGILVTNVVSFLLGYKQREMEYRNAEKNLER